MLLLLSTAASAKLLLHNPDPNEVAVLVRVAPECKKYVEANLKPEEQKKAQKCEVEGQYAEKTVEKLQAGDTGGAEEVVAESFQKCAGFSEECAVALAPRVVQKMRFAGLGVTNTCAKEMQEVQGDKERMKKIAKCEHEGGLAEKMLAKLDGSDLDGALTVAEKGLEKCIGFETKGCEEQLAPVVVNQLVQRVVAARQQMPMMPLFVSAAGESGQQQGAHLSLLKVALFDAPAHSTSSAKAALLETGSSSHVGTAHEAHASESESLWVSKLLLSLATEKRK